MTKWTGPKVAQTVGELEELIEAAKAGHRYMVPQIWGSGNGFSQWDNDFADQETIIDRSPLEYGLPKTPEQKCDCGYFKHKFPAHVRGCPAEDYK